MGKERRLFLTDIGEVKVKKRKGSRRLSIRINPAGEVYMNVPLYVSYSEAEKFLIEKRDWISDTLVKVNRKKPVKLIYNNTNLPRTKFHEIILSPYPGDQIKRKLSQGLCEIFIPASRPVESEEIQEYIRNSITEVYRKEAKVILVNRCAELAEKYGFSINRVNIKKMKSRWGSCSAKGNINLNLYLMAIPDHLVDYVILHELVHTRIMNHSTAFWKELERIAGDVKGLRKELRGSGNLLMC